MNRETALNHTAARTLSVGVDGVCLTFLGILLLLCVASAPKVPGWQGLSGDLIAAGMIYAALGWVRTRLREGLISISMHTAVVLGLFAFLFQAMAKLQHILVDGWLDDVLISFETSLIGTESSVFLQRYTVPIVTEWMMYGYVIYVPMLPAVALLCYRAGGIQAAADYLLNLSLVNVVCYAGFILFPVAGPLFHAPGSYAVPLSGGLFTWCGEWIRLTQHYAGGNLPSPHCGAATVMLGMLFRHYRRFFWVTLPTVLTLYVSTVYGRYHYSWDGIIGIISGLGVLMFSPRIAAVTESIRVHFSSVQQARALSESASDMRMKGGSS